MKKKLIALAVCAGVVLPGFVNAAEVAGKALEIYGKAHVSLDSVSGYDTTTTPAAKQTNLSLSSNSSRLGFKGEGAVGSMTGFYKIEGSISFENSGGVIDHRAAYAGLKGSAGSLLLGYRDTPFKDVRGRFDVFGDTVGDARNIMGVVSDSYTSKVGFDQRAKNAIMYSSPKTGGFQVNAMYSTSWENNTTAQAGQDNNNDSLSSVNILYKADALSLAAAWEQQSHVCTTTTATCTAGDTEHKGTGTRLVAAYDLGTMRIGLMYENLDDDTGAAYDRNRRSAYGANFVFKAGAGKVKLQYINAKESDAKNDGANEVAVGYDYKLDKHSSTYIAYSKISNDANAAYFMGAGHDQKYTTAPDQDVSAFSVGYIYSF